jgi:uncharacterized protein YndB with AHSA1/START domain
MKEYRFDDRWTINAPIDEVYRHIADPRTWDRWWPTYDSVRILEDAPFPHIGGRAEFIIKSPFGYRLRVEAITTEAVPPFHLKTIITGELESTGDWQFSHANGTTIAEWTWIVRSNHPLINRLEWFAKPLFALSHNLASQKGHWGLKRLLEAET